MAAFKSAFFGGTFQHRGSHIVESRPLGETESQILIPQGVDREALIEAAGIHRVIELHPLAEAHALHYGTNVTL